MQVQCPKCSKLLRTGDEHAGGVVSVSVFMMTIQVTLFVYSIINLTKLSKVRAAGIDPSEAE
jgi:hypothetical protein